MSPKLQLLLIRLGFPATVSRVMDIAAFESRNLGHNFVGSEHVLCALVRLPDSRLHQLFSQLGADSGKIRSGVASVDTIGPHQHSVRFRPMTPRLKRILTIAESEAARLRHLTVPQSLLLGIIIEDHGVAVHVLRSLKYDLGKIQQYLVTSAPTPVGAVSSAIAVSIAVLAWVGFFR
ncbi:MAG: Clp protease N-terminal domain-containing protein [Verrucomicrobiae bacterium]|nr:Clp protease N-terminal domain-containing protein [Verrucomicrobiae bacterium]